MFNTFMIIAVGLLLFAHPKLNVIGSGWKLVFAWFWPFTIGALLYMGLIKKVINSGIHSEESWRFHLDETMMVLHGAAGVFLFYIFN